jgi:hypothetical protein
MSIPSDNQSVADQLREAAALLHSEGASPSIQRAYRRAADAILDERRDIRSIFESGGARALDAIPGVGLGIAGALGEMLTTGRWSRLERLRGNADPVTLLQLVPGIGPSLATRIHDKLDIDTLEGLEAAAHDGRLESIDGLSTRRAMAIRASLEWMLRRAGPQANPPRELATQPTVREVLDVDRAYREAATGGKLRLIAPRRFNPSNTAHLPVMHTRRGPWHFTALYSNTALANQLGHTRDWVVIYFYDGDHFERQCTVVTETHGDGRGARVVRGREAECRELRERNA